LASDGTLVYRETGGGGPEQLVWKSRTGGKLGVVGQPQERISAPLLSPDGKRVVVYSLENGNQNICIHDTVRGLKTRLTSDAALEDRPIWSPDGKRIAFASNRSGNWDVFIQAADGSGRVQPLLATPQDDYLTDWSRDGKYLIFGFFPPNGTRDIGYVRQGKSEDPQKVIPFLATPFNEGDPNLSPNGRFLAYSSNESGRFEVYVQRFPEGGGKVQVSAEGGVQPRWRGDSKELYYVEGETLVAAAVTSAADFSVGKAVRLFEHKGITREAGQQYDVSAAGQRFVVREPVGGETSTAIRVVQNWFAEFGDRQKRK
jgi:Tol biopolymer transport system component